MRKVIFLCVIHCGLLSCTNPKTTISEKVASKHLKIDLAGWIIGAWFNESKKGVAYEVWKKYNDTTFVGRSYSIQDGDTVSSEFIKLVQQGDEINYIPTVPDQNMGMPITFKLISISDHKLVFENKAHDFPQVISYEKLSEDSLVAEISGMVNGKYRAHEFPMQRLK